jgi:hypothetical protein
VRCVVNRKTTPPIAGSALKRAPLICIGQSPADSPRGSTRPEAGVSSSSTEPEASVVGRSGVVAASEVDWCFGGLAEPSAFWREAQALARVTMPTDATTQNPA